MKYLLINLLSWIPTPNKGVGHVQSFEPDTDLDLELAACMLQYHSKLHKDEVAISIPWSNISHQVLQCPAVPNYWLLWVQARSNKNYLHWCRIDHLPCLTTRSATDCGDLVRKHDIV